MSTLKPTAEQAHIADLFRASDIHGSTLKVRAGAGTGKTTTLLQLSEILADEGRLGLYVAFNKSIAQEAGRKFGRHMTASTAHSLAYRGIRATRYANLLDKMADDRRIPFDATALALGVRSGSVPAIDRPRYLSNFAVVRHVLRTLDEFCKTADLELGAQHVPKMPGVTRHASLVDLVLPYAKKAWANLLDPNGSAVKFGHSHYLKLWALERPRIGRDGAALFLDEAQDTSPVLAAVIADQTHLQRVYVGDSAQAIYGFTGAVDAMKDLQAAVEGRLTQSWRFGPEIAAAANFMLARLRDDLQLTGNPGRASMLSHTHSASDAILCRTNGGAISHVMAEQIKGRKVHLMSDTAYSLKFCDGAERLQDGRKAGLEDLAAFDTWQQVEEYAEESPDAADWKVLVKLINDHGADALRRALKGTVAEDRADVTIATAHKSKGREWDNVTLDDDIAHAIEEARPEQVRDELMLGYVAITRAKHVLNPGALIAPDIAAKLADIAGKAAA